MVHANSYFRKKISVSICNIFTKITPEKLLVFKKNKLKIRRLVILKTKRAINQQFEYKLPKNKLQF